MNQISKTWLRRGRRFGLRCGGLAVLAVVAAVSGCGDADDTDAGREEADAGEVDDLGADSRGADAVDAADVEEPDVGGRDGSGAGDAATDTDAVDSSLPLCPVAQPLCGAVGQPALQDAFVASAGRVECVVSGDAGGTWSLGAPDGSLATLTVDEGGASGAFDVDVAGTYNVALSVPDGDACVAAEARATVTSAAAAGLDQA